MVQTTVLAKPFLKWAGGKTQLLPEIENRLPFELINGKIKKYIEPFVGSGAVLFHLIQKYDFEEVYIYDKNPELIIAYNVIKNDVKSLIDILCRMEQEYLPLEKEERKDYFYKVRGDFNATLNDFNFGNFGKHTINRAAQFIFLNRTCFNGLFRVNKKGEFNVPMGDYKAPQICNNENLISVSKVLQNVKISAGDYTDSEKVATSDSFFYFDPPYRPLNISSSFTSYTKFDFNDEQQIMLAQYFKKLDKIGAKLMLSNSDPRNSNSDDDFFETEELYGNEKFLIERVSARRNINSKGGSRGKINEILVTNY